MIKAYFLATTISLFATHIVKGQGGFNKIAVADIVTMQIPDGLYLMSDDDMASRYITAKKPLAVYTNGQRTIELSVNESNTTWELKDLPLMKSFYKASIQSLYDKVKFFQEDIVEVNKRKFAVFEFNSSVKGDKSNLSIRSDINKYTYILYTIHKGKTYLISFSCPFRDKNSWEANIKKTMASLKLK